MRARDEERKAVEREIYEGEKREDVKQREGEN